MAFCLIEVEKGSGPINRMCRVLGTSQSGFFALQDRPASRPMCSVPTFGGWDLG